MFEEIGVFVGFSLIWFPLIGGLSWGVFQIIKRISVMSRFAVLISCIIVAAGLRFLQSLGGAPFDQFAVYELIHSGCWMIVGMLYWSKLKRRRSPISD